MANIEKIGPEKKQFSEKNKLARNRVNEWGLNYSREKKYITFGVSKKT